MFFFLFLFAESFFNWLVPPIFGISTDSSLSHSSSTSPVVSFAVLSRLSVSMSPYTQKLPSCLKRYFRSGLWDQNHEGSLQ
jgi:hypothetical protein